MAKQKKIKGITLAKIENGLLESFVKQNEIIAFKTLLYIAKSELDKQIDVNELKDREIYRINIDIKKAVDFFSVDKKTIDRALKKLEKTTISYKKSENGDNIRGWISVLPYGEINYTTERFEVGMFGEVLKMIFATKNYSPVATQNFIKLKSKHSVRMLMLLERILNYHKYDSNGVDIMAKRQSYELNELNELFGTNYKSYNEFMRTVLEPAKNELDMYSKISFLYTAIKDRQGEKVNSRGRTPIIKITIDVIDNYNNLFSFNTTLV